MSDIARRLKASGPRVPDILIDDIKRHAADEGLIDVAYAPLDSPVGPLVVAASKKGLVRISYVFEDPGDVIEDLALRISPRVLEAPQKLDEVRRQLDEYFERKRTRFDIPIDWALTAGFTRKVLRATARVPYGATSTYRAVATKAGSPRASRAAGNALGSNPIPIVVPCHRILHSGGGIGGYTGGLDKKLYLLGLEGAV
ncbi:MAG: methylated-DNA--[protein]-cysteine S-methyltransferase [Actinomycetota bacterium]|nr:methylated-DNA--[protein]-cysteine S-methyltransferase [Actinomycetota bacterium]